MGVCMRNFCVLFMRKVQRKFEHRTAADAMSMMNRLLLGVLAQVAALAAVCRADYLAAREEEEQSSGSGGDDDSPSEEQPLSPEAIANIAASATALLVLGGAVCYLLMCFDKQERMQRVRMAQERNRQITRQLEEARRKKREQQPSGARAEASTEEERRSAGSLLFSQVHHSQDEGHT